ncbi:helix-turn-helix transcriptional regulator [Streptomyces nigrescens]|uniref:Transcriptional regulator n=1 Tax=Streptomyces nigrescens TaxID=1920 RepID=A0A640TLP8_STRNI|nr:AraC family transcriptional regulator [Streptomyces libani]WAT98878.1 AraC family transcriptional regulator [Streptomyces libani subsp. libani]GFE24547.1 transcriptional regulator [Streptomyces libani subsp. libani]GGV94631.1 transcriptional regulator [Streptomyces libani subsp. libani]
MVRKRQVGGEPVPEIREVAFSAPAGRPAGVEVLTLAELRARADACQLATPHRPGFHHLLLLDRGRLVHSVDFREHLMAPGDLLWSRPGQVQHFGDLTGAEGRLVLFEAGFLDPATAAAARIEDWYGPPVRHPEGVAARGVAEALRQLHTEFGALGGLPLEIHLDVLRHLLAVLVLRAAHPGGAAGGERDGACAASATYLRFRDAVERGFTRSRRVADYARSLGYAPRTLSRATEAAAGVGAKEFIDRRVALEAKRLLAHGDQSAARIADRLGFADATNFSKFFQRQTGTTPIAFRMAVRGGAG